MSSNGFQDDSSECSSDEYEIVSHQSENDQLEEESVSGSARDGAEMTDETVSHGSVDGEEEHEDGDDHDLVQEDRDDDGSEEEKNEDNLDMPEEADEEDAEEVGSTPTIVPCHSEDNAEEEDFDHVGDDGMLHFKELKIAEQDGVVLGVLAEHSNETGSAIVRLPMSKDKLKVGRPFRIYYGGPDKFKTRVLEKIGDALVLSKIFFDTDSLGNPERFDLFIVSPPDAKEPEIELMPSTSLKVWVYSGGLRQEDCYDLVVLVDDDVERHLCVAWDLPTILIDTRGEERPRRITFNGSMLYRHRGDLSSVNTDVDTWHVEKMPNRCLATAVNLDFFESIEAEQLNKHIASLMNRYGRANRKLQKSALGAAVETLLNDACDTVCEVGFYINHSIRDGLNFCMKKIPGSAPGTSLPTQERRDITATSRVSAKHGKWLRTLITLLGTFMLLRLSTYAVGALVINPSLAVGSYVGSNTLSYFHDNSNQSSVAHLYDAASDVISQRLVTIISTSQPLEKTQPTPKLRSDIMPIFGSESRALAQHTGHKERQPSKKCSKKCRAATWTLMADNEKLILTPTSKSSWGRAPCAPTLVSVDQYGSLVNTTLIKINSDLYELMIDSMPNKEVLLVSTMLKDGYLIKGHMLSNVDMPALYSADANATAIAVDYMLSHRSSYAMDVFHKEFESLDAWLAALLSEAQGGAAALLETCSTAISSSYSKAKVLEKDSTKPVTKENSATKPSQYNTKAIAAAYKSQLGHIADLKASAWSKAQGMFSRSNGDPTKATARDYVQEFQHKSKVAVEKMQKDTLSAVKKASSQAKTLKAGLKKKTTEKMSEKKVQPVPYGRRA